MKLFFRKYGSGQPLIILHGLFGQSDNWNTLAKQFAEKNFEVYTLDLRNHGLSPWSDEWNYNVMSRDVLELVEENKLQEVILIGHSLGGKVAMQFALNYPERLSNLIVVDIAPKEYVGIQENVLNALLSVRVEKISSRKEAEEKLKRYISDAGTWQFLLKNLNRGEDGSFGWRFNLKVIADKFKEAGKSIEAGGKICSVPALFMRGENSGYIPDGDIPFIKKIFPRADVITVPGAGHWIHADKPKEFFEDTIKFIRKN